MTVERVAYTPLEAAEALACSRKHIYELVSEGEIRAVKIGRLVRIPVAEMNRLLGQAAI